MQLSFSASSSPSLQPVPSLDAGQAPTSLGLEHDALAAWNDNGLPQVLVATSDTHYRVVTPGPHGVNDRPVRLDDLAHLAAPPPEKTDERAAQQRLRLRLIREASVPELIRMPVAALGGDVTAYETFLQRLPAGEARDHLIDQWFRGNRDDGHIAGVMAITLAGAMANGFHDPVSVILKQLQSRTYRDVNAAIVLQAGARAYVRRDGDQQESEADVKLRQLWQKEVGALLAAGRLTPGEHRSVMRVHDSAV
ncbi:hypothetical protein [Mitsuaria sp. 7]|uniref:hypothetical protein n=1 Tax=Mitsuaria sp. 7 TaxID=1658665 RepID=UPI0007DD778E|nr:hypothetical protein [Mitsuaria sp. 7]ANH68682.1 hypothetical protein ABE85_15885 [Mitsuaria sp. 7]